MEFSLPFLTREMLKFEQATVFSISLSSVSGVLGTVVIRGATRSGVFTLKHTLTANNAEVDESFNVPDIPIWLTATISGAGAQVGEVYLRVSLALNGDIAQTYFAGYIYDAHSLSWPVANVSAPTPTGMGRIRQLSASVPAAGSDPVVNLTPSRLTKIKYGVATLTTSATVANRVVHFTATPAGATVLNFISSVNQAASTTRQYTFCALGTAGSYNDDNDIIVPIAPDIIGYDEYDVRLQTTNLQAGDQWSQFRICVEEWVYAGSF
jgi:hypothetical protein